MRQYLELLQHIRKNGVRKPTRTKSPSTGKELDAYSVFGYQMRFDLREGFPLLTTKALSFNAIAGELLWFLAGDTNIRALERQKIRIWTDWPREKYVKETGNEITKLAFGKRVAEDEEFARKWGNIGPMYGKQWRAWEALDGPVDQIGKVIEGIREVARNRRASVGRRLIVSAWNVADLPRMALAPCHALFQFDVTGDRLSCHLYQRSADVFLGVPYNIASYALLTHLVARETGLEPGEFIHTFSDVHIYENHVEQVDLQLARAPKPLPKLVIRPDAPGIFKIGLDRLEVKGYAPDPTIVAEVAV